MKKILLIFMCLICAAATFNLVGCAGETYTVEYEANGGTVAVDSREVKEGEKFTLDVPYLENATFLGWFDSLKDDAEAITDANGQSLKKYDKKEDLVVFAHWDIWETLSLEIEVLSTNNGCVVNGGGENLSRIKIPETYKGLPVVMINSYAFYSNRELKEIIIPETVIDIGSFAFSDCEKLEKVALSDNLETIGKNAFSGCGKLATINVSKKLSKIDSSAFSGCSSLYEMDFSNVEGSLEIEASAFSGCSTLSKVKFNSGIKKIKDSTFLGCAGLQELDVGDYIEEIEPSAFQSSGLRSLKIGKGVKSIGSGFTNGCASLRTIEVDEENGYFLAEGNVLYNKNKTTLLRYAPLLETEHYTIENSVKKIAEKSFDNSENLKRLTIPESVIQIEQGAFTNLKELETIDIPYVGGSLYVDNYFTYIFGGAMMSQETKLPETLQYVNITGDIEIIAAYAFQYCGNIKTVSIPESVEYIGVEAFYGCSSLTEVVIPKAVTTIGELAFYACMRIEEFEVEQGNTEYVSEDGVLYNKDKTKLLQYPAAKTGTEFTVPSGVTHLSKGAFYNATKLEKIVLSEELKTIDDNAFSLCRRLENIVLPSGVEYIGNQAFSGCRVLEQINIPSKTTKIGSQCFDDCRALIRIDAQSEKAPEIDETIFDSEYSDAIKIYFENESVLETYKKNPAWNAFADKFVVAE